MEKIELPIEIEKKDLIKPTNPDFSWFGKMLVIVVSITLFLYLLTFCFSYLVIKYLPLQTEKELFGELITYLDTLEEFDTQKLENNFLLNDNYKIYVSNSKEINAYAMIGGNILINKGLIENLEYEEELLFIIAHEIYHVENRDVLRSILKDIPFYFALGLLGFDVDFEIINLSDIIKSYSDKKTELNADNNSILTLNKLGLNLSCASNFFKGENNKFEKYLNFIGSHPTNENRIKNIENKNINADKDCTILNYSFE